ncbi:hypothetical protein Pmani_012522 [Petrolisthes manimaculis]|uniref:E3 ubiquitin-protein ligase E3D n=1 Tax=Petrolisthes manimaculis TaxID=1843537 RepID=A0AAE1Q0K6_9EUCA|nr:hypothetical protein Pmani_012522 [Petrolisthes manimaculis]
MFQVLAEVMPNIATCNIYITLPDDELLYQTVVINKQECIFSFNGGSELCLKLPRGSWLDPNTVKNIKQEGNILTARLQMDKQASVISALAADILGDSSNCEENAAPSHTLVNTQLVAQCTKCKNKVLRDVEFNRVLPLPSVDWEQASEDWFCHLHETDSQKLKPRSLQPALDDCFYTSVFFLIHSELLTRGTTTESSESDVYCNGCSLSLGTRSGQSAKLWTHSIVWLQECERILYQKDAVEIVLSLFHNIDKDNFGVNCRLVLQSQTLPRLYLYMITMSTNHKLLISQDSSNGGIMDELDHETVNGSNCTKRNCETDMEDVGSKRMCKRELEMRPRCVYAVKLLYQVKEGEDEETGGWVDDVNVHIIPCSVSMLEEVRDKLITSTSYLPTNMKVIDDLSVGYIVKNRNNNSKL